MINRFYNLLLSCVEREYFTLSSWYIVGFVAGIITAFRFDLQSYYIMVTISICLLTIVIYIIREFIILKILFILFLFFTLGIMATLFRQNIVSHHTISKPYNVRIKGRIESIKPSITGLQAIIKIEQIEPELNNHLEYVRINFSVKDLSNCFAGDVISFDAKISQFLKKIVPKGFDFFFYFYYSGIGAIGKNLGSNIVIENNKRDFWSYIQNLRKIIYEKLLKNLDKTRANFGSAILLGEEKGIDKEVLSDLRYSGISHNFDAGIHLPLLMAIIFFTTRFLLNISNYISHYYNIKVIAALISLIGGFFYLLISGLQIAPTRVFFMTSLFILAIIINRVPDILRALNFATFIILIQNPEFVFHPSFQLSFVAVLALVSGFQYYNSKFQFQYESGYAYKIKLYLLANIYTTIIASIATAPIVIYHFHIFSNYTIFSNLIAVPITSLIIMPIGLISLIFMIFDLEYYILQILGFFIDIIIDSAHYFVSLPNSVWFFGFIESSSLLLYLFGLFLVCFSKSKVNWFGFTIIICSFILMIKTPKPDLVFEHEKKIIGIKNQENQLEIYGSKYNSFIKDNWTHWFGLEKSTFYLENMSRANMYFLTNNDKKIYIVTSKYQCVKSDLFINNVNNRTCNLAKQNFVKKDLIKSGVISVDCSSLNYCKINY